MCLKIEGDWGVKRMTKNQAGVWGESRIKKQDIKDNGKKTSIE